MHASDVPIAFLFDSTTTATSPSLLIALIPLAVILGIGSLMPRASGARVIGALGVLAVVVLFAVQLNYVVDRLPGVSTWDVLDTGFYVAGIAGLVALVSGFYAVRVDTAPLVRVRERVNRPASGWGRPASNDLTRT